jgi:succinate dehydrogenase / fumarate reductase membrane anchor subunit
MTTQERIGTHRLVVGAHYGTRDFIVQRITAIIMAVYTLVLFFGFLFSGEVNFENWRNLFTFTVLGAPVGQLPGTPGSACATSGWTTLPVPACAWPCTP